jgi:hypothetical protein
MALSWFLGLLAACGDKTVNWESSASVPDTFFPAATRLVADGALLGGYIQGGELGAIQDQRAAMFLWNGRSTGPVYDGPGWIVSLAVEGSVVWAIAGTLKSTGADSDYRALRSLDGGASWEERGPVPGASVLRVLAIGANEAWVLGMGTLLRTTDAGQTWVPVAASGSRDGVHERLATASGRVLISGDGVRGSADGGGTWLDNGVDGSKVYVVDGGTVLARHEGALKLGVMEPGAPRWVATFPAELQPFRLVVEGATIRFLALPGGKQAGDGLRLYESLDSGTTWTAWRIPGQSKEEAADLGPGGRGLFLDSRRRIHAPSAQAN